MPETIDARAPRQRPIARPAHRAPRDPRRRPARPPGADRARRSRATPRSAAPAPCSWTGCRSARCTFLAVDADGTRVRTVEGLADDGGRSARSSRRSSIRPRSSAGSARPGMLMAATALLEEHPDPTREDVDPRPRGQPLPLHRLRADRRCGPQAARRGPRQPRRSARTPGPRMTAMRHVVTGPTPPAPIGVAVPRRDGSPRSPARPGSRSTSACPASPTPGSCAARTRTPGSGRSTSPRPRAHPGVIAVVTADDLADVHLVYGHAVADHPLIADGQGPLRRRARRRRRRRGRGHGRRGAPPDRRRLRAAAVRDQTPAEALADAAPIIHEKPGEQRAHRGFEEDIERTHPNVCSLSRQAWGDIDAAFAGAAPRARGRVPLPDVLRLRDGAVHGGRVAGARAS